MNVLAPQDLQVVRRTPPFAGLPEAALARLLAGAHVVQCQRGKLLFLRGEPASRFFLILEGWVKLFRDTPDGEQTVIAIMKPGETIGEAALFMGGPFPVSAEVVDDARIVEIAGGPFLSMIREDSDLALTMLAALSKRMRQLVLHIEQIQSRSTPQRLGEFLLGLSDTGEGSTIIQLPYDKSLVAARLGMKPESLSRALAKLRSFGVTTSGNRVDITDIGRLKEFCQGEYTD